ncbi:lipolytic protein [Lactobacillus selangorensis]|uniref:Lipolytic protein n=1 Tax=Lactobacillus selangorensis TaxID=81857 RepID=A0A0R2FNK2_9LACO|nr:alpha/beta hydrolase [Lactobacillus selangorensis]KRN27564.1 lipolytic protein [Lactobacillus selangorensis]KRN30163.1 lipolytic protein [Lactobacillus selangorensis]
MTKSKLLAAVTVPNTDYLMKPFSADVLEGRLSPQTREVIVSATQPNGMNDIFDKVNHAEIPPEELRKMMGSSDARHTDRHPLTVADQTIAGDLKVQTYVQTELKNQTLPVILFIHGGGFTGGSLDNIAMACHVLADDGAVKVIAFDYGLAPEHPYPEGLLACYRGLVYLHQHADEFKIDPEQMTMFGDSAGGNLTYTTALLDLAMGTHYLSACVTLYPVTYQGKDPKRRHYFDDPANLNLTDPDKDKIAQFLTTFNANQTIDKWYIKDADPESMYISPLNAPESLLKQLPRTLFMVGEFDPLRLQGEAFYKKVKLAGGDIRYIRYNGMTHAFMDEVGNYPQADDALGEVAKFVLNK